jgi:HK97 family phage prohead protease
MMARYGKFINKVYSKSELPTYERALAIRGRAIRYKEPMALQSGEIVVFLPGSLDASIATKSTEFYLAHDETQVVGSCNSGLELHVDDEGVVFQMPLTNKRYAEKIKELVKSNRQSAISIGITRSKERTETVGKHQVVFIEQADLRECSLVAEGCCEQAFAYLIDINDAPSLKDSINSPSFKLESTAHNLHTQYRKRAREFAALTNRISELQQTVDDDRAHMTFASHCSDFDTVEALQKAARRRLGLQ